MYCNNKIFSIVLGLALGISGVAQAHDDHDDQRGKLIKINGVAVIGDNNLFQKPLWDLGAPFGTAFFNWVFAYNPDGLQPFNVTADMPGDTVLAGGIDPVAQFLGLVPDVVDQSMINVPLHQTPVIVDNTGLRAQVPSAEGQHGLQVTRSLPNNPVTIATWLKASGRLTLKCNDDGSAVAKIRLKNLLENGVYTLWTIHKVDSDGDGAIDGIAPYPFGGVPNVLVPDEHGRTEIKRRLGYCPTEDENLLFVDVAWHSDGNVYGGAPDLPFAAFAQPMGSVTHTHVQFPISVSEIK